ncbi:4'-phosphopantetheinyl transferase superfamily protein [Maribellus sp. YY47]|uniref:4'-phosphopantetheinyl transferase family protein n=1 Tax=Maribellus sp. YY47 TaxID=2929486 RepID=UPI0020007A74|nr:4'-phosphopantetheinyl transferase superfamily protein [Maribellus sp. YY47]MCK3682928.1 4'-phosphopantetheinyl transferase superfamily protein [Maribellus sp. YY47]
MPFIRTIENKDGKIGIWQLAETPEILLSRLALSEDETTQYSQLKAEKRQKEFLTTRILLSALKNGKQEICYTSLGKPYLPEEITNISISHSANYAVVFLSDKKIGIDIEQCDRNMNRVADRFLSQKEKALIEKLDNPQFARVLFWAAKEAIFKCTDAHGINFREQILIDTFVPGREGSFTATLQLTERNYKYLLYYFPLENNVLVYCVEQEI